MRHFIDDEERATTGTCDHGKNEHMECAGCYDELPTDDADIQAAHDLQRVDARAYDIDDLRELWRAPLA